MKTQGEIDAAICEGISRFEQDHLIETARPIMEATCFHPWHQRCQGLVSAGDISSS
jgi:hypothetical protein